MAKDRAKLVNLILDEQSEIDEYLFPEIILATKFEMRSWTNQELDNYLRHLRKNYYYPVYSY